MISRKSTETKESSELNVLDLVVVVEVVGWHPRESLASKKQSEDHIFMLGGT
jgi:hypothetical protein